MTHPYCYPAALALVFGVLLAQPVVTTATTTPVVEENTDTQSIPTPPPPLSTEERAAKRAELTVRAQARITNLAANVSTRLENSATRFEQIIPRLEARIEILKQSGVDTSLASVELEKARIAVQAARAALATIDNDVAAATESTSIREQWFGVSSTYRSTYQSIAFAKAALTASVDALQNTTTVPPASTTPITSPQN